MSCKRSAIWQHFDVSNNDRKAKCSHCNKIVVVANGSTGNLFRHVKINHPHLSIKKCARKSHIELQQTPPEESEKSSIDITPSTIVVHQSNVPENSSQQPAPFYLFPSYGENKIKELNKQLLRIIVKNLMSFNVVESQEFIKFVCMLNSSYVVPNRKTLSNDVFDNMYQLNLTELKCSLENIATFTLTIDCWISINNEHFIAFIVHYLDKGLKLKSNYLQCFSSPQNFNSNDVTLFIEELMSKWNLCNKILAVVTDGSEAIAEAVHNSSLNQLLCFAHILNQVVEAGLAEINQFVLKVRNVVQYIQKNPMVLSKFYDIQSKMGLSDTTLEIDIPSRWDTTFNMLTIFLRNKVPLLSIIEQLQLNFFKLSTADFHYLESAVKILTIFNSVKIAMCSENYVSLSKVPHLFDFMSKHLQEVLKNTELPSDIVKMGNAMKDNLSKFEDLQKSELVCQAVLLDPRFKKRGFPNDNYKEACTALRRNVATAREELSKDKSRLSNSSEPKQNGTESEDVIDMWSEFESKDPSPPQNHTTSASVEVDAFLSDLYLPLENDPLNYWANISNRNKFPALFELAKAVLSIPATSVPCHQIYSKTGYNFLKKRRYLPSTKVDKILFLHYNA